MARGGHRGNGKGSVKSTGSTTITVTAPPATSLPTLAGLTLVNAQTDQDIRPLTDNSTIDLAAGSQLSVRPTPRPASAA